MGTFSIDNVPLVQETDVSQQQHFKELNSGAGATAFGINEFGMRMGSAKFETAPFSVDYDGLLKAANVLVTGGTVKYGKTSFTDSTNAGYYIGAEGVYIGSASDGKYIKYTLGTGVITVRGTLNADDITAGTITGRTIQTAAPAAGVGSSVVITGGTNQPIALYYDATLKGTIKGYTTEGSEETYINIEAVSGRSIKLKNSRTEVSGALQVSGKVFPNNDNAHELGDASNRWSKGHFEDIAVDDCTVNISLSKPGGSFMIDHPLKPETHILRHSFVESPDMLNIYKGRVTTVNGFATVALPEYFEALNREFEYSLTPIKSLAKVAIKEEIINNSFEIMSDVDCEVSWVVYGVRHDKFAEENRIIIEEEKLNPGYMYGGYENKPRNSFDSPLLVGKLTKARKDLKLSRIAKEKKI